jgi:hypothetical protein
MILLQKEWNKIEVDFEKWLLSDISLSFQILEKKTHVKSPYRRKAHFLFVPRNRK